MKKQVLVAAALLLPAAPSFAQEECSTAVPISGQGVFVWDNVGFADGSASCGAIAGDYWFEWTADVTGTAAITTCALGSEDTIIAAYDACGGTELDCNDDDCGARSTISFPVTGGTSYFLQLGHVFFFEQGAEMVEISILPSGPANDDCASAIFIGGEGSFPFDSTGASDDDPGASCGPIFKDVWFQWQAADGTYTIDVCDAGFDTKIAVWDGGSGGGCPPTIELACNDDACGLQSSVSVTYTATAGGSRIFYIQVGAFSSGEGAGNITITRDPCSEEPDDALEDNDDCASAVSVAAGSYPELFCWKLDEDWYSIEVLDGETLTVDALFLNDDGDIDLRLYDACGGTLLDSGLSVDDNEQVMWTNTTGGAVSTRLWVEVWDGSPEDCNDYDMIVDIETPPIGMKYCTANANSTGSPADASGFGFGQFRRGESDPELVAGAEPARDLFPRGQPGADSLREWIPVRCR